MRHSTFVCAFAASLVAGCGGDDASDVAAPTGEPSTSEAMTTTIPAAPGVTAPAPAADSTVEPTDSAEPVAPTTSVEGSAMDLAAWQTIEIVDVDGDSFTLAELIGAPVLVETFATWCSNCRAQLADTQAAAATVGDTATVLALSVETDLSPEDVAAYAADNGSTDVRFAVMSPELLAAFAEAFGTTVANAPSTPKIIITADGVAGELQTGPSSADDLVDQLRAAA